MTHFSHPGKKYNRSCLLSLENNSRHVNEGARTTFGFESLKMFTDQSDFNFTRGEWICGHSLVTVESSDINEEYILIIGGYNDQWRISKDGFKFTGSWFRFGKLNKRRYSHKL